MNYNDWSNQYYVQEKILKNYIKKLKTETTMASPSEFKDLNYRISLLYSMYLEVKHTGKYLKGIERRERIGE